VIRRTTVKYLVSVGRGVHFVAIQHGPFLIVVLAIATLISGCMWSAALFAAGRDTASLVAYLATGALTCGILAANEYVFGGERQ
jgi:hypothetical protein